MMSLFHFSVYTSIKVYKHTHTYIHTNIKVLYEDYILILYKIKFEYGNDGECLMCI